MQTRPAPVYDLEKAADHRQFLLCLEQWRAHKQSIVVAPGVFDLLGPHHLYLLDAAAKEGDILIAATPDDYRVTRLKGPDRPIYDEDVRLEMLSRVRSVDCVVLYREATPQSLLELVKPDVLVKSTAPGPTDGTESAKMFVRVPPLFVPPGVPYSTPGELCSTTGTLKRIRG